MPSVGAGHVHRGSGLGGDCRRKASTCSVVPQTVVAKGTEGPVGPDVLVWQEQKLLSFNCW